MASLVGLSSSIHHTPSLDTFSISNRRITSITAAASCLPLPFTDKAQFNALVVAGRPLLSFKHSFVPRAVATPNSVLSEQAFKGLSLHQDQDGQDVYEAAASSNHDDELDISKLGLPQRLVDSLLQRGITHLFPIQVKFSLFST